jgi:hypothetical protein
MWVAILRRESIITARGGTRFRQAADSLSSVEEWEEDAAEQLERLTGSRMADALRGTIRIVALSAPSGRGRYQTCEMELVLEAPELPPETLVTEVVFDRRYWPSAGMVLRARISRRKPRMIDVNWDALAQKR